MATMNISLPDAMKDFVEARVATGMYGNSSDVIRDLVRHEQVKLEKIAAMQKLVDEARASGVSPLTAEEVFTQARERVRKREAARGVQA